MEEIWKDIKGYEGLYQLSNMGNVRSLTRKATTKNGYVQHINGCAVNVKKHRNLRYVRLNKDGLRKQYTVEKLLKDLFPEYYSQSQNGIKNIEGEIWKDIKGFNGVYQCSNKGRIKTIDRFYRTGKDGKCIRHITEAIMKPAISERGYLRVTLRTPEGRGVCRWVHNIVARTFTDNYDTTLVPNHIDGNKKNNCIENLELITNKENIAHAIRTGLTKNKGEDSGKALLSNADAKNIRIKFIAGANTRQLATEYKVGIWVIRSIINNKNYKDENYICKNMQAKFLPCE